MKFVLAENIERASEQAEMMFTTKKPLNLRLPPKPLVVAWLKQDWKKFNKALESCFAKLWKEFYKYQDVLIETDFAVEVRIKDRDHTSSWPWPEISLALIAFEHGVDVAGDPLFLPEAAFVGRRRS